MDSSLQQPNRLAQRNFHLLNFMVLISTQLMHQFMHWTQVLLLLLFEIFLLQFWEWEKLLIKVMEIVSIYLSSSGDLTMKLRSDELRG